MAKSKLARIEAIRTKRLKLEEQEQELLKAHNEQMDKEREKRQRTRGEVLEKLLPETVNLTAEQFMSFLNKTTSNPFGRGKLAEIIKESEAKQEPAEPPPGEKFARDEIP